MRQLQQLLYIYKASIVADAGKQNIANGTTFDTVRTDALRKVRDAILDDVVRELERQLPQEGNYARDALCEAIESIQLLKRAP